MDYLISRADLFDELNRRGVPYNAEVNMVINGMPSAQPEPIKINIDHELTKEEYEKLRKDMADAPIVLLPSAQPEIVRCKDCRHNQNCDIQYHAQAGDMFFCAGAERRTDEAD